MRKPKNIKEVCFKMIDKQEQQLIKERDYYQQLAHDNSSYWGGNGPVRREERAVERRDEMLRELYSFRTQLYNTKKLIKIRVYAFGCKKCGCRWFTTVQPFSDWHECPSCRGMIFISEPTCVDAEIVDEGPFSWTAQFKNIRMDNDYGE